MEDVYAIPLLLHNARTDFKHVVLLWETIGHLITSVVDNEVDLILQMLKYCKLFSEEKKRISKER